MRVKLKKHSAEVLDRFETVVKGCNEVVERGILYAPDYVINAGGIIDVYHERIGFDRDALIR